MTYNPVNSKYPGVGDYVAILLLFVITFCDRVLMVLTLTNKVLSCKTVGFSLLLMAESTKSETQSAERVIFMCNADRSLTLL